MACLLCGTAYGLEWRCVDQLRAQVTARYKEGPFAYRAMQQCCERDATFCVHCLNHLRKRKKNVRRRTMLPADQYLLGLLSPGLSVLVDNRSKKRLERVMTQPANPYRRTELWPLHIIMESKQGMTERWWNVNLHSRFFSDRTTARIIRQKIKVDFLSHAR